MSHARSYSMWLCGRCKQVVAFRHYLASAPLGTADAGACPASTEPPSLGFDAYPVLGPFYASADLGTE